MKEHRMAKSIEREIFEEVLPLLGGMDDLRAEVEKHLEGLQ